MADQTGPGTLAQGGADAAPHEGHNPGRPISWAGVTIVTIGFIVGGVALVPGPRWWMFWLGTGIAVVGLLILGFARTFDIDWY